MGISTSRYLPANGTAGFARSLVNGNNRVPWPPPIMTERTLLVLIDWRPVYDIETPKRLQNYLLFYSSFACQSKVNIGREGRDPTLSLIHISEPTRLLS